MGSDIALAQQHTLVCCYAHVHTEVSLLCRPSEYLELFQIGITAAHKSLGRPLRLYAIWDPEVRRQNRAINRLDQ